MQTLQNSPIRLAKSFLEKFPTLISVTIVLCLAPSCCAQTNSLDVDHFDGSKFKGSQFKDASLDKQVFRELLSKPSSSVQLSDEGDDYFQKKSDGDQREFVSEYLNKPVLDGDSVESHDYPPVHELPGDWVPSKIDLTSNGGFTTGTFNGSPVPYNLNGHVDVERARP